MLIKKSDAKVVDLGSKVITKYTSRDKNLEINLMRINGRHPEDREHFVYEEKVHFMLYVTKGIGKVYLENEVFEVEVGDTVDVPPKCKFAVEGEDFEYLALQTPAWSPEQGFIVDKSGNVVEDTKK